MEKGPNKLYTIYNQNTLYIREIDYINYTYKDLRIIKNFNYNYLTKSIDEKFYYGIDTNRIAYFGAYDEIISMFKFIDYEVEFFYEIPSEQYKEIVIKRNEYYELYFYERTKYKLVDTILNVRLCRQRNLPIDYCPFIYYEKDNILGLCVYGDLIHFIDMKTHSVVHKINNLSTTIHSILYSHKINDEKYFVAQNIRGCFNSDSIIYIGDISPKDIYIMKFEKQIKTLELFRGKKILFARFSKSMNYLILRFINEDNELLLYSNKPNILKDFQCLNI